VAAAFLTVVICIGSAFLWIGVPVLGFWLAGQLTTTSQGFLFFVLLGVPVSMVGFGWLLYRINSIYEGLRGGAHEGGATRSPWNVSLSDERSRLRRARAPRTLIDVAMTTSAVVAIVLALVWFLFFAHTILAPMG
jgi:hypothetical protein